MGLETMTDSDDDLPIVCLDTPIKDKEKTPKFKMPNASEIAARRKLEIEQDEIIRLFNSSTADSLSNSTPSSPEKDLKNFYENNLKNVLKDKELLSSADLNEDELELDELIIDLKNLYTNPGIKLQNVNLNSIINLKSSQKQLIYKIFKYVENSEDNHLNIIINNLFEEIIKVSSDPLIVLDFEDILFFYIVICSILLSKRCQMFILHVDMCEALHKVIKNIPENLQNIELINLFTDITMQLFEHFHDRLFLAECLERVKCDPLEIDCNHLYFSNKLSKYLLYKTLCELAGYKIRNLINKIDSFYHLKQVISNGNKIKKLEPYQQYVLLNILNKLNGMLPIRDESDRKVKEWFLTFFISLKCYQKEDIKKKEDFFQVKVLCAFCKHLWLS